MVLDPDRVTPPRSDAVRLSPEHDERSASTRSRPANRPPVHAMRPAGRRPKRARRKFGQSTTRTTSELSTDCADRDLRGDRRARLLDMVFRRSLVVPISAALLLLGSSPAASAAPPPALSDPARPDDSSGSGLLLWGLAMIRGSGSLDPGPRGSAPAAQFSAAAWSQSRALARSGLAAPRVWRWPLEPAPVVLRRFQMGPYRWSAGHRGVDLAAGPSSMIRAPADGQISFAGLVAGRPVLSIDHGKSMISSVEPVAALVRTGQFVRAGQVVGVLSAVPDHCAPVSCLHWGVRSGVPTSIRCPSSAG